MNVKIGLKEGDLSKNQTDLLSCCRYLAENTGEASLAETLFQLEEYSGPAGRRDTLTRIIEVARKEGFQTQIFKPQSAEWPAIAEQLPAIAELRNGGYLVVSRMNIDRDGSLASLAVIKSGAGGDNYQDDILFDDFQKHTTGGLLRFAKINTALVCFSIVAKKHNIELTEDRLRHEYNLGHEEVAQKTLLRMSKDFGLRAKVLQLDWRGLLNLHKAYPVIARLNNGRHMVILGAVADNPQQHPAIACFNPLGVPGGEHLRMTREEFASIWTGEIFILKRIYKLHDETQPFSLRWFIPEILRQRTAFVDIAVAVLFIHGIALVTPVFLQIVIDKVLVNQAFTTLHVLGLGMTAILLVNGCLDFLRDYLLLHATNKIDLRVTSRTFRHMLNLPLGFFEKVSAGVLTKHMQQTANIRGFLTGSLFLTMLEASSLLIFLPFLFFYSLQLTAIVLACTLLIATVILVLITPFKRRLNALYDAEGDRQAMLVETINGMPTVKAMAIEPLLRGQWEQKVARAISMQFRVGKISITAKSLTQLFERLMTVLLIWVGAYQVFSGVLSIGALIAFQMLAGRVTSPLVRLVGLIHQYQEAALSVEKLGAVMNARPEWGVGRHGARPSLKGDIIFERVSFRYAPDLPPVLKEISLTIPSGTVLGIVGPSGSGKTTLTRLLQKAYFPSAGVIRINNCYLNEIDTTHLRQNTGIVLQESFLFKATVAENIRAGQAGATREQIIEAAILAGADEFIVRLPQGYDTMLEEGARNMSGGQRQRLAIARALLTRPEILILDEATSSLDPESERIVRENLAEISRGRTVCIVSHRLSMLKDAERIIVLEEGRLVSYGSHNSLLEECGLYQKLWRQQMEFK